MNVIDAFVNCETLQVIPNDTTKWFIGIPQHSLRTGRGFLRYIQSIQQYAFMNAIR